MKCEYDFIFGRKAFWTISNIKTAILLLEMTVKIKKRSYKHILEHLQALYNKTSPLKSNIIYCIH